MVIKTHCWSNQWDSKQADHIFLTHRDLQGVVASYRRVGWAFNIPDSYVEEHQQWQVDLLDSILVCALHATEPNNSFVTLQASPQRNDGINSLNSLYSYIHYKQSDSSSCFLN